MKNWIYCCWVALQQALENTKLGIKKYVEKLVV